MAAAVREIEVTFLGPVRRPEGVGAKASLTIEETTTVGDVLSLLGYDSRDQSRLRVLVDGRAAGTSDVVGSADLLSIFLPLGGG